MIMTLTGPSIHYIRKDILGMDFQSVCKQNKQNSQQINKQTTTIQAAHRSDDQPERVRGAAHAALRRLCAHDSEAKSHRYSPQGTIETTKRAEMRTF